MTDLQEPERTILHVLASHVGPEAAITRHDLMRQVEDALGKTYKSDRAIRNAIENLRSTDEAGAFICALYPSDAEPGYFLARNEAEAREYMLPDYSRANNILKRLASQEALLNRGSSTQIGMAL